MKLTFTTKRKLQRLGLVALIVLMVSILVWFCWVVWVERFMVYSSDGATLNFEPGNPGIGEVAVIGGRLPDIVHDLLHPFPAAFQTAIPQRIHKTGKGSFVYHIPAILLLVQQLFTQQLSCSLLFFHLK